MLEKLAEISGVKIEDILSITNALNIGWLVESQDTGFDDEEETQETDTQEIDEEIYEPIDEPIDEPIEEPKDESKDNITNDCIDHVVENIMKCGDDDCECVN